MKLLALSACAFVPAETELSTYASDLSQRGRWHLCCCRSTNYKKWFTSAEPYAIKFRSGYEPYVLVARKIMPWYDERFRGYGWDKVRRRPCL